jgi:hydrogenase maturation protein HypF
MEFEGIRLGDERLRYEHIHIDGIVQGVGFRPFVYRLAKRYGLRGWVRNSSKGVDIRALGDAEALDGFASALAGEAPPLARITGIRRRQLPVDGHDLPREFVIVESKDESGFTLVSPDVATCRDCLRELFDPNDRRYRYPFINCTNCGPRFSIIRSLPYDRPNTTMAIFPMCEECRREYEDPMNRRFHAQPNACPECGPEVWLEVKPECVISFHNLALL